MGANLSDAFSRAVINIDVPYFYSKKKYDILISEPSF